MEIDEGSIRQLGRWPWARSVHARLIDRLKAAGAKTIVFDVLFTEPDSANPASDARMADSIRRAGNVVLDGFFDAGEGKVPVLRLPLPAFAQHALTGFVNIFPDPDGVARRMPLVMFDQGRWVPSLAVAALMDYKGQTLEQLSGFLSRIPVNGAGDLFLNYCGPYRMFPYVSYADALKGKPSADFYRGKIVLVGGTATALFDMKPTPFTPFFPGVEIQATLIDNLITESYMTQISRRVVVAGLVLLGCLMGLCLPRMSPWRGAFLSFALVAGIVIASILLFRTKRLVLDVAVFAVEGIASYMGVVTHRLVIEEREKRWIRAAFGRYLSPKIIRILVRHPARLKLGGEVRDISIFFSDIDHFTAIAEELGPTRLVEFLNRYLTTLSDVILRYDGVVDKYIGDAVMAFWNAPLDQPRHARAACLAALDCQEALKNLRSELVARGLPPVYSRIGLNTGVAKVGNMGSKTRFSYTAIGDSVNLASRLEGANKTFGTHIIISESTYESAKADIEARLLDRVIVIGSHHPIQIYELLSRKGELTPRLQRGIECYQEALALYYPRREFAKSLQKFIQVLGFMPDDLPAKIYIERCQACMAEPPRPEWDGVYTMVSK